MYIARILYPVKVLGPGLRIGIWFAGCKHHCQGCSNPELWEFSEKYMTTLTDVMQLIESISDTHKVDGFTLTGGDPIEQHRELVPLLKKIGAISDDILCYTGYTIDQVREKCPEVLSEISVLIDGKYIEKENHEEPLRGSQNQNIIILKEKFNSSYSQYINHSENQIQNFFTLNSAISVGIHKPGYESDLNRVLIGKGLLKDE